MSEDKREDISEKNIPSCGFGRFDREIFFTRLHYRGNIPDLVKDALASEDNISLLFQTLDPLFDMPLENRIIVGFSLIALLSPHKKVDKSRVELQKKALFFLKDLFFLEGTRNTLMSLLLECDLKTIQTFKSFVIRHIPNDITGERLFSCWMYFSRDLWHKKGTPESALEYAETLLQAICFEGIDLNGLPLPENSSRDEIPRELLRRRLFAFIHNQDPKWNVERAQRAFRLLGYPDLSEEERAFGSYDWRVYPMIYDYALGMDNRTHLRRIAQDLLEEEEIGEYKAYASLFHSTNRLLAVDSAYAFIQATQFRMRKPKGPAEEFRKLAVETIDKIFNDPHTPADVHLRILDVYRGRGDLIPMLELFEKKISSPDQYLVSSAFTSIISCWMNNLFPEEKLSLIDDVVNTFLLVVKAGSDELYEKMKETAQAVSDDLKIRLRKNLKTLLADVDVGPLVRKRALEALACVGEEKRFGKKDFTAFREIMEDEEDEGVIHDLPLETKPDIEKEEEFVSPVPDESRRALPIEIPRKLQEFLNRRERVENLKKICTELIREGDLSLFQYYHHLFNARDLTTGKVLFEHILASARVLLEYQQELSIEGAQLRKQMDFLELKAKEGLFYILFDTHCPDLIKLEAFEILKNLNYFDINKADTIKKFALAFVKDAIVKRSQSMACKGLADLISLRTSPPAINSVEGKNFQELMEDFVSYIVKERDDDKRARIISLLHYISFQDVKALQTLSSRIHPLNFREILSILEELVKNNNRPAGNLLIEIIGNDYRDIRNHAVTIFGRVGVFLYADQKKEAISAILNKIDDCYDEEVRKEFLEVTLKIDLGLAAAFLLNRCLTVRIHERKEFGDMLFKCLERMNAMIFTSFCESDEHLEEIKNFITKGPRDSLSQIYAKRFLGLYRENFITVYTKERWEELQKSPTDSRRNYLREISRIT